jgi:hypothetical protein
MKQQPDNFFSEKLKGLQKTAPPAAWSKIENNLSKKNNRALWLKIAAALLVLATAFTFILVSRNNVGSDQTARLEQQKEQSLPGDSTNSKSSPVKQPVAPKETSSPKKKNVEQAKEKKSEKEQKKKSMERSLERPPSFTSREQSIAETSVNTTLPSIADTASATTIPLNASLTAVDDQREEKTNTSVKIVYNAADVQKYLNKKSLAEATTDEKKTSTLKKVLDKAYDLKHNQDPLGELRQKKNEILALNFRNDKQRNQNR